MKKILVIVLLGLCAAAGAVWYQGGFSRTQVPSPLSHQNFPNPSPTPMAQLPEEINLDVPFTTQAPKVNWDADHEEFCEEASVLMAAAYINNFTIPNADFAEEKLQAIKNFELGEFGYFQDTTAAETAVILKKFYKVNSIEVVANPSLNDIKQALAKGKIIVAPFAGRELGNPNFTGDGPLYHMLVIKGYTKDGKIITNDPGTRKGANYIYSSQTILDAMHDWNHGDVTHGAKAMIIVG
ncbi:MAG: C39 family peptidase [Candidatus Doudnabacteria bacterium]|nr:C39 family peptidase [Candidatus Doudnabacteria bacterium]